MSMRRTSSPSGSLAEHEPGFRGYLVERGYSASAAHKHLQLLADLNPTGLSGRASAPMSWTRPAPKGSSAVGAPRAGRTCARHPRWIHCWPTCVSWA
jgi:hypothetical protein